MTGKTRIWIGMILLFISGVAVGFFGSGLVIRRHVREFVERGPVHMNARIVGRALEGMDLSDEQRSEIDSIIGETSPVLRRLSIEFGDSLETVATEQFDKIKAVLDEDQVKILEDRIQKIRARFRRDRRGHPRGRRPGVREHPQDDKPGG
jgi:hypothetical protein